MIPAIAVIAWLSYLYLVSNVLPYHEEHPNGQASVVGSVKRVGLRTYKRHGRWIEYHADGQRASEGLYHLGRKDGVWRYWDRQGRLTREETHGPDGPTSRVSVQDPPSPTPPDP